MSEFDLIARLEKIICLSPGSDSNACKLGIGDDAAILDIPAHLELVVCVDTLVEGVHFPESTEPAAIGYKSLAVNLSDLAAMGAIPSWFFMALTLPSENSAWLDGFAAGMAGLARDSGIMLAGGDTTSGPLSVTVTALGLIEKDQALTRSGADAGDLVVISGRPGSAAHALKVLGAGEAPAPDDLSALEYPVPRLQLGTALLGLATSCIDLSDGLLSDLGHILEKSGVGAELDLERLPCPESLVGRSTEYRWPLQLAGGDDYELCFTVPPGSETGLEEIAKTCGVELTVIGHITSQTGIELNTATGELFQPDVTGYRHFSGKGRPQ